MRAVIFDFDGVIMDTEPVHQRAVLEAVAPLGFAFDAETFVSNYVGLGDVQCFRMIASAHGHELTAEELAATRRRKIEAFNAIVAVEHPTPHAGVLELIRAAAEVVPIGVCSGSRREEVVPILEAIGVVRMIGAVVTADDVTQTKPDPEPYIRTARLLAVAPGHCVALEDTPTGIASAKGAGMRVVAVCHSLPATRLSAADRIFPGTEAMNIADLLE